MADVNVDIRHPATQPKRTLRRSRSKQYSLIKPQDWAYLMIAALWIAAGTYVLTSKDAALPAGNKEPKQPPLASLSFSSNPKNVTYEAFAPARQEVTISYLDEKAQTQLFVGPAPWRSIVTTRDIGFVAGMTVLTQNGPVTCRISVDGQVVDEKTGSGENPSVSCNLVGFQKLPM
jgi:hypothetical protein